MDNRSVESDLEAEEKKNSYIEEIEKIRNSKQSTETKLKLFDLLVRDFLRIRFQKEKNIEYSELITFFLKNNQFQIAILCHEILKYSYSGDKIPEEKLSSLLDDAKTIIEKEIHIIKNEEMDIEEENSLKPFSSLLNKFKKKKDLSGIQNISELNKRTKSLIEKELGFNKIKRIESKSDKTLDEKDLNIEIKDNKKTSSEGKKVENTNYKQDEDNNNFNIENDKKAKIKPRKKFRKTSKIKKINNVKKLKVKVNKKFRKILKIKNNKRGKNGNKKKVEIMLDISISPN